jgi:hypothetical protein
MMRFLTDETRAAARAARAAQGASLDCAGVSVRRSLHVAFRGGARLPTSPLDGPSD